MHIKKLERYTTRKVRNALRKFMGHVDSIDTFDRELKRFEKIVHDNIHDAVGEVYHEGYNAGELLIRKHIRKAAIIDPQEDVRIAKYTEELIYGLSQLVVESRDDIQYALRGFYAKGYTFQRIRDGLRGFFDDDLVKASRFARTATNDIYNRAHLNRYQDSGVVDGVEYGAHIDARTSEICRMLNGTLWKVDDPAIQRPPSHFHCRSRLIPYFKGIPGPRDYTKDFDDEYIKRAEKVRDTFLKKYWTG